MLTLDKHLLRRYPFAHNRNHHKRYRMFNVNCQFLFIKTRLDSLEIFYQNTRFQVTRNNSDRFWCESVTGMFREESKRDTSCYRRSLITTCCVVADQMDFCKLSSCVFNDDFFLPFTQSPAIFISPVCSLSITEAKKKYQKAIKLINFHFNEFYRWENST